jgi:hypothetical protein
MSEKYKFHDPEGLYTVRLSIFGNTLPIVEDNINLGCKDTHAIVIPPLEN